MQIENMFTENEYFKVLVYMNILISEINRTIIKIIIYKLCKEHNLFQC